MFKRLNKIIRRLKRLYRIANTYDNDLQQIRHLVGEHTTVHADVHFKSPSQIIAVGRFKNHDYVRIYEISHDDFEQLIRVLKDMEQSARIGRFDIFPFPPIHDFIRDTKF